MRQIDWTPELIGKFWDGIATTKLSELSFGRLAGPHLLRVLEPHLGPGMRCLDYGCGDGDLVECLLRAGHAVAAYEPSRTRASKLLQRLSGYKTFLGILESTAADRFDVVFFSEVIEHIRTEDMPAVLDDLHRLVKPGGLLIVTTPNEEPLDHNMAYDPVSDTLFHRWQHLRTYSEHELSELLHAAGFETLVIHKVELSDRAFIASGLTTEPSFANLLKTGRPLILGDAVSLVYVGQNMTGTVPAPSGRSWWQSEPLVIPLRTTLDLAGAGLAPSEPRDPGLVPLPPEGIATVARNAASCRLPRDILERARGEAGRLMIWEDYVRMGPPEATADAAIRTGRGSFAIEADRLIFSSIDGTCPSTNGRTYRIRALDIPDTPTPECVHSRDSLQYFAQRLARRMATSGVDRCAIYGGNQVGRILYPILRAAGIDIPCIIDRDASLHGMHLGRASFCDLDEAIRQEIDCFALGTLGSAETMTQMLRSREPPGSRYHIFSMTAPDAR